MAARARLLYHGVSSPARSILAKSEMERSSWIRQRVEGAIAGGLQRAYKTVKVDPQHFLQELRLGYELPVQSIQEMRLLPREVLNDLADRTIATSMKLAAAEGLGMGFGGIFTLVPDMGILAAISLRMVQKLSLIYGFDYATEEEIAELWIGMATAAGLDTAKDLVERHVVAKFVPKMIQRIAAKASAEVVEKWAARIVPLLSGVLGGALNYYFIRQWGSRAKRHYEERLEASQRMLNLPRGDSRLVELPSHDPQGGQKKFPI
jgi:hypothetical protein